jgi:photosystem II stability/assembly factor-like uncharacterized protein
VEEIFNHFHYGAFMKKIGLVLSLVLFFSVSFQVNAQWEYIQVLPTGYSGWDLKILNEHTIILVGSTIYKSMDGGLTWTNKLNYNNPVSFTSIFFIDTLTGWASDSNEKLFKTTDGGENWLEQFTGSSGQFNTQVFFANENIGWLTCQAGLKKTTNGGLNWTLVADANQGYFRTIQFTNQTNGWTASGNSILKTTDSGFNWFENYNSTITSHYIDHMFFLNQEYGWAVQTPYVLRTTNGGQSWSAHNTSLTVGEIYDISFQDSLIGAVVGSNGHIYVTSDGGINWNLKSINSPYSCKAVDFYGDSLAWVCGPGLFKSTDQGQSWDDPLKIIYPNISSVKFNDLQNGWAIGVDNLIYGRGVILKTTDSGYNWNRILIDSVYNLKSLNFVDANNGWFFGDDGNGNIKVYITTNSGNTWTVKMLDNLFGAKELFFVDAEHGWLVGDNGIIYKSTDGGNNWQDISIFEPQNIFGVYFINSTTGWISREFGGILKTTDGGFNWVQQLNDQSVFSKLQFINANTGFALGNSYSEPGKIFKTTDGGLTWSNNNLPGWGWVSDIFFVNENIGYLTPYLYKTTDGGANWDLQITPTFSVTSLYFSDSLNGWGVGSGNRILKTTNGGVTFIEEENNFALPEQFLLQQNYPNPFNPSTKISWQAPVSGWQTLKVYDILGKEVATLVDEFRNAGSYNEQFTINNVQLSSGVYFYQLRVGDYLETKKMILLK